MTRCARAQDASSYNPGCQDPYRGPTALRAAWRQRETHVYRLARLGMNQHDLVGARKRRENARELLVGHGSRQQGTGHGAQKVLGGNRGRYDRLRRREDRSRKRHQPLSDPTAGPRNTP